MADPGLIKQWQVTTAHLVNARRYLVLAAPLLHPADDAALTLFDELLEHNELGLAMETIAELGECYPCRGAFWKSVEEAAKLMKREDCAARYRQGFVDAVHKS